MKERAVLAVALLVGFILALLGLRFLLWPEAALRTFGVAKPARAFELHYVIGLRDLWLGLLALALAWLRDWRALAVWFALGTAVALADGLVAAASSGKWPQVAFHFASAILCAAASWQSWRLSRAS
jgi:hypothetical protein